MSESFIGEVMIVGFDFPPRGWANCNNQLMEIAQNTALFSIFGTTYGGDGRTQFALPNLQGRTVLHPGTGTGLSPKTLGEIGGVEDVTLTTAEMPSHDHTFVCDQATGTSASASNGYQADFVEVPFPEFASTLSENQFFSEAMIGDSVGGQPHSNIQPCLALRYVCALEGLYPSRS